MSDSGEEAESSYSSYDISPPVLPSLQGVPYDQLVTSNVSREPESHRTVAASPSSYVGTVLIYPWGLKVKERCYNIPYFSIAAEICTRYEDVVVTPSNVCSTHQYLLMIYTLTTRAIFGLL